MKWFALILSFYVLGLVSLPCADGVDHNSCSQTSNTAQSTNHQDHTNDDSCSPFCVCSCCSMSVTINQYFLVPVPIRTTLTRIFPYYEGHTTRFDASIWQPPKEKFV